jgi:hypothetical protein
MPVILPLRRLRLADLKFEASLDYMVRHCLETQRPVDVAQK